MGIAPLPIGFSLRGDLEQGYPLRRPAFALGAAKDLNPFLEDHVFFSVGILIVWGGMTGDPFADCIAEMRKDLNIFEILLEKPLFSRLTLQDGDPFWNHCLWVIEKARWEILRDYLCSLIFADEEGRRLLGIGRQDLQIVDPLALERRGVLFTVPDKVPLFVFGINSSDRIVAIKPPGELALPPLEAMRFPPSPVTVTRAEAYFSDDPKLEL